MKYILSLIFIIYSLTSLGQLDFISPYRSYTKEELTKNIKNDNDYYSSNLKFAFKGTKVRTEYSSTDTLFNNLKLKRITNFNDYGEVLYDSLIFNNQTVIRYLIEKDTIDILQQFRNNEPFKSDTFIFNQNHELIEYRTESLKTTFSYNKKGLLIQKVESTPSIKTIKNIDYYSDSITITQIQKGKFHQETKRWFYYFNEHSQIIKDSTYILKQSYRPPNYETYYRSDTSSFSTLYYYDKKNNHIETLSGSTKYQKLYKRNKVINETTYSNGEILEIIDYNYVNKNFLIKKHYDSEDTNPKLINKITYNQRKIVQYISINNNFQLKQKDIICLDKKGRILSSCKIVSGDDRYNSINCKKNEYVNY